MQDSDVQTVAVVLLPPIFTIFGKISAGLSSNTSARTQVTLFHARGVYRCFCSVVFKGFLSFCCFLLSPKLKKIGFVDVTQLVTEHTQNSHALARTWVILSEAYVCRDVPACTHVSAKCVLSQMRSKGSVFTLEVWGWGCVRQTLRNRSQPLKLSATVHSRSQPFATVRARSAVPLASYKMVTFGNFQYCVASFRVAGVASHMFHNGPNVSKVVLCDRRNTVASFSKDELHFLDSATLWRTASFFCVAGAALQTCRVAVFFCESHRQGFPATKYADHLLKTSQEIASATQTIFVTIADTWASTQYRIRTCLETFENERFVSFPLWHGDVTRTPEHEDKTCWKLKTARCPCFLKGFLRVFSWTPIRPQNRCFVQGFRQFSSHLTKCHACHGIRTLSPLDAALTMRFAKKRRTVADGCGGLRTVAKGCRLSNV